VLAALELAARTELIASRHFPPVSDIFRALRKELGTATLWTDLGNTLQGWGVGLALALAIAVPLGLLIGSSPVLYRALRVPIEFLRPIPSVALIPLVVLVYGTGLESKVFLVVFACIWPLLIQTVYGVQDADPVAIDTARAFGVGRAGRFARVMLPGALPYIATGVRIASSKALILAVVAELVIGADGLGRAINLAQEGGAVEVMYALIVVIGMVGWGLNSVLALGERRILHWHSSRRPIEVTA
jgi:ABC-type nitrate/sulfonate/bicarbonate transport system permease component